MSNDLPYIDLHIHSENSDGSLSVEDLSSFFVHINSPSFFSITDHNYLTDSKVRRVGNSIWIPGIEVSTEHQGVSIHLTAYSSNPKLTPDLEKILSNIEYGYNERASKMYLKLKNLGYSLPKFSEIRKNSLPGNIYTFDIAKALVPILKLENEKEVLKWCRQNGNILFVEEQSFLPDTLDVINLLHDSNFLVFWAHPGTRFLRKIDISKDFYLLLKTFISGGLDGIEAFYTNHSEVQVKNFIKAAEENDLLISSGSDYHGYGRGDKMYRIDCYTYIKKMLARLGI